MPARSAGRTKWRRPRRAPPPLPRRQSRPLRPGPTIGTIGAIRRPPTAISPRRTMAAGATTPPNRRRPPNPRAMTAGTVGVIPRTKAPPDPKPLRPMTAGATGAMIPPKPTTPSLRLMTAGVIGATPRMRAPPDPRPLRPMAAGATIPSLRPMTMGTTGYPAPTPIPSPRPTATGMAGATMERMRPRPTMIPPTWRPPHLTTAGIAGAIPMPGTRRLQPRRSPPPVDSIPTGATE